MNDSELELLLNQQYDNNEDDHIDFTATVMSSLPRRRSEKMRLLILIGFTSLGSFLALLFIGATSTEFFTTIFNGLATYNPAGISVALIIIMLYTLLFLTTSEELG